MSRVDVRDGRLFVSPDRARSLLTVRAAISLARLVERPCFFSPSLMCSYCRSRLLLHADRGIFKPPRSVWVFRNGAATRALWTTPVRTRFAGTHSRGGFWTLCSVAYSSVSLFTT